MIGQALLLDGLLGEPVTYGEEGLVDFFLSFVERV